jgi:hypothetical protein
MSLETSLENVGYLLQFRLTTNYFFAVKLLQINTGAMPTPIVAGLSKVESFDVGNTPLVPVPRLKYGNVSGVGAYSEVAAFFS